MTGRDEGPFEFPCEFPVKAVGRADVALDVTVVEIVRRHVRDIGEGAVRSQPSRNGRFVSITVTITARNRAQLDAIYRDLSACDDVLMAL